MKSWQKENIQLIHRVMIDYYGDEFIGTGRKRDAAEQRMMFCSHAYRMIPGITLSDIAQYICRSHATVIHSINRADELCAIDKHYLNDYEVTTYLIKEELECVYGMLGQIGYEI